tara:strand:- start:2250 stop:2993 length:744 start_codon:yes stop_codon:yes gene_type:complete
MKTYDKKKAKVYALLTAYSYPKRRLEEMNDSLRNKFLKTTRKVDLNSKILKKYKKVSDLSNTQLCTFINKTDKEIVLSIRGTDISRIEEGDVYADIQLICGSETNNSRHKSAYNRTIDIYERYNEKSEEKYKIILCGASLGGRIAINILDSILGKEIHEVHVFNCATSFCHLYKATKCLLDSSSNQEYCKNRKKLHIHLVNEDPISILSTGELSDTKTIYEKKLTSSKLFKGKNKIIKKNHSILNFV